jgi:Flp pilus assembly protein TadD
VSGWGSFNSLLGMSPRAAQEAQAGRDYFSKGRWTDARQRFLEAIRLDPGSADYYYGAAMCDWANGRLDEAGQFLRDATRLDPNHWLSQAWLGEWYLNQGMIGEALKATEAAINARPDQPACMQSRAWVLEAAGNPDAAWEIVQKLINIVPMTPSLARLYGRLAGRYGQHAQALDAINRLMGAGLAPGESSLNFTAAELLDRAGRYDDAFAMALHANAAPGRSPYNPAAQQRWTDSVIDYFTRQRLASLPKATLRSDKPVFIVGMPRSGTSLVEQILASHPQVHGAGELDFVYRVFIGTLGMLKADLSSFPACLDKLTTAQVDGMAHVYLGPFLSLAPEAARITDKMPLNFLHLGLISRFFPEARIIHCRRGPMDTCLSCFLTYFNSGNEFKHNLTHLGHFYRMYERLMAHWKSVIDLPMMDVSYEEVVGDPEAISRRMIDFLGLKWDDACLNFHTARIPCVTASVAQVRRPIYDTSVGRWRRYEKHLGPLKAALWGN